VSGSDAAGAKVNRTKAKTSWPPLIPDLNLDFILAKMHFVQN
jgi:hypothetical protein